MSKGQPKEDTFAMAVSDAVHIKMQTELQLSAVDDLLSDYFSSDDREQKKNLIALLCESYNVNYKLNKIVTRNIDEMPRETVGESEELLLNTAQMTMLQTLTLSQYMINAEMVRDENVSTAFH
mgnify:CR=1 FL=1